jgi:hypothetical protein
VISTLAKVQTTQTNPACLPWLTRALTISSCPSNGCASCDDMTSGMSLPRARAVKAMAGRHFKEQLVHSHIQHRCMTVPSCCSLQPRGSRGTEEGTAKGPLVTEIWAFHCWVLERNNAANGRTYRLPLNQASKSKSSWLLTCSRPGCHPMVPENADAGFLTNSSTSAALPAPGSHNLW